METINTLNHTQLEFIYNFIENQKIHNSRQTGKTLMQLEDMGFGEEAEMISKGIQPKMQAKLIDDIMRDVFFLIASGNGMNGTHQRQIRETLESLKQSEKVVYGKYYCSLCREDVELPHTCGSSIG